MERFARRYPKPSSQFKYNLFKITETILTTKKQCPSWPTGREVMTTSSCWVRGYNSTPSPTVQSTPVMNSAEHSSNDQNDVIRAETASHSQSLPEGLFMSELLTYNFL